LFRLVTEFSKSVRPGIADAASTLFDGFHMKKLQFFLPCLWQEHKIEPKIKTNPRSGIEKGDQHEIRTTHPVPIPAGVERHVWVLFGSGDPLHNSRRLAERAQRLRLSHSARAGRRGFGRTCRHLQPPSPCTSLPSRASQAYLAAPHNPAGQPTAAVAAAPPQ
jgi:hypothetical protein